MSSIFEVVEGVRYQSSDETRIYTITTTNLVSAPTSPTAVVYDELDESDATSTVMSGVDSHSADGDVITLKAISGLTKGHSYRVEFAFTVGDNDFERFFIVKCPSRR